MRYHQFCTQRTTIIGECAMKCLKHVAMLWAVKCLKHVAMLWNMLSLHGWIKFDLDVSGRSKVLNVTTSRAVGSRVRAKRMRKWREAGEDEMYFAYLKTINKLKLVFRTIFQELIHSNLWLSCFSKPHSAQSSLSTRPLYVSIPDVPKIEQSLLISPHLTHPTFNLLPACISSPVSLPCYSCSLLLPYQRPKPPKRGPRHVGVMAERGRTDKVVSRV